MQSIKESGQRYPPRRHKQVSESVSERKREIFSKMWIPTKQPGASEWVREVFKKIRDYSG